MIFVRRSKIFQTLLLITLSASLIACDSESSSNSSDVDDTSTIQSGISVNTDENGNNIITTSDTVVEVDPEGNTTVLEDPNDNVTISDNPDGGSTVTTDGGIVVISPDGLISETRGIADPE